MNRSSKIIAMFSSGMTMLEIGERFGITRARVQQLLSRDGYGKEDGGNFIRVEQKRRAQRDAIDAKYMRRFGLPFGVVADLRKRGVTRKFTEQRNSAKGRNIEWRLTLGEWWEAWQKSGHWAERGRGTGYCMARKGDAGPYAVGNIYFCTIGQNFKDSYVFRPASSRKKADRRRRFEMINGHKKTLSEWAALYGIPESTLRMRIDRTGLSIEKALTSSGKRGGDRRSQEFRAARRN